MSSTFSTRFRLNYQAPGDNLNSWGTVLNTGVFQLLEDAVAGRVAVTLNTAYTLTTANGSTDESRKDYLDVTSGTGGTITAPSVEKSYTIHNGILANVVITTGSGLTATVVPGETARVVCDGTNFRKIQTTDFGAQKLTSIAVTTNPQDASTKNYVDITAFSMAAGSLPGQVGNDGKYLQTNAGASSWQSISATAAQVRAGSVSTVAATPANLFSAAALVGLVDASSIALDLSSGLNFSVTLGGNRTLANPTNAKEGQSGIIKVVQDGTGSRTLAYGSAYKFPGGAPALSTAAGTIDIIAYFVDDAATPVVRCTLSRAFA